MPGSKMSYCFMDQLHLCCKIWLSEDHEGKSVAKFWKKRAPRDSEEPLMPTWLAQHEDENGMMEAACLQAVSKHSADIGGAGTLRLHPRYILGRRIKKKQGLKCGRVAIAAPQYKE
jgi:hypothetical protein